MVEKQQCYLTLAFLFLTACGPENPELPPPTVGKAPESIEPHSDDPLANAPRSSNLENSSDSDVSVAADTVACPGRSSLSVATWNLEFFPLTERAEMMLADTLSTGKWDLIAVQEIADTEAFWSVVDAHPNYSAIVAFEGDGFTRVGTIYRNDILHTQNTELLFENDSWAFPRPVLKSQVFVLDEGGEPCFDFTWLVVHLKAKIDDVSEGRRREAVVKLLSWINEKSSAWSELEFLVAGDWNDEIIDPDPSNVFDFILDDENYAFATSSLAESGAISYITYPRMLDHVMHSHGFSSKFSGFDASLPEVSSDGQWYEENVSDHWPVLVEYTF